ncbi:MAG: TatD family hydrolase [Chloroflexi bacterium]|nr:TatD family hydrolase [Chloroflexota bacterium]
MTPLVDTHSHPHTRMFNADRDAVLVRAREAGVGTLIVVGTDPKSNRDALALARSGPNMWATAGIHPHDAKDADEHDWFELAEMARDPLVVALGEMGLDFFRNISPRDVQRRVLQRQLDLCAKFDLPAVIHSRDAEQATWEMLEPWLRARRRGGGTEPFGVMHCYAYGADAARRYADLGFMISIPGTVTYLNNQRGQEVARTVPEDVFVLETDCPYLTPQSRRGKRNEPAFMVETLDFVARLRGEPREHVAAITTANAHRLFRLPATGSNHQEERQDGRH